MPTTPQYYHNLQSYSWTHIATNTTTLVKSGGCILHQIVINKSGATANVFTIYDGIDNTGTVLGVYDGTMAPVTLTYDTAMITGICIVTATGTAVDLTVTFL